MNQEERFLVVLESIEKSLATLTEVAKANVEIKIKLDEFGVKLKSLTEDPFGLNEYSRNKKDKE